MNDRIDWCSVPEVSRWLRVSDAHVRRLIEDEYLEAEQMMAGGRHRIHLDSLFRFLGVTDHPKEAGYLTTAECASRTGASKRRVQEWIVEGRLIAVNVGNPKRSARATFRVRQVDLYQCARDERRAEKL